MSSSPTLTPALNLSLRIPRPPGWGAVAHATVSLTPSPRAGEGWGEGAHRLSTRIAIPKALPGVAPRPLPSLLGRTRIAPMPRWLLPFSLLTLMLVGWGTAPLAVAAVPAGPMFAFVLLGQGADGATVPMVRSVTEGAGACPELRSAAGAPLAAMTPRARPPGGGFDAVLVCEALYPLGAAAAVVAGSERIDLPAVSLATPRRLVLLGDTGCRGAGVTKPQPCGGEGFGAAWPFAALAGEAVRPPPDLIIHVGDYNYRGTPGTLVLSPAATGYAQDLRVNVYDTGDLDDEDAPKLDIAKVYWSQNIQGSPRPDAWPAWRDDFFRPAARLLPVAPWVFLRGNHELCSRGGPGWFYLLDPASSLLGGEGQRACPPQTPPGWRPGAWPPEALPFVGQPFPNVLSPPYRLRLGELDLVIVDSANAGDAEPYQVPAYTAQYQVIAALLADGVPTWLLTHRPLWGVVKSAKGGPAPAGAPYGFINVTQQAALDAAMPAGLPANVGLVLSGHMHRFQASGFAGNRPPQLVVGDGGMEMSELEPRPARHQPLLPVAVPNLAGANAEVVGLRDFGFMELTPGAQGAWTGTLLSPTGRVLARCDSASPRRADGQSICKLH